MWHDQICILERIPRQLQEGEICKGLTDCESGKLESSCHNPGEELSGSELRQGLFLALKYGKNRASWRHLEGD